MNQHGSGYRLLKEVQGGLNTLVDELLFGGSVRLEHDVSHGTNRLGPPIEFYELLVRGLGDHTSVTEYTAPEGAHELRESIAIYETAVADRPVTLRNVLVTHGASEALCLAAQYLRYAGH